MTRHETFAKSHISQREMVLATDLDGTFLGGSDDDRKAFYDFVEANRHRIVLIFVTGRDPGFIVNEVKRGLPAPEYVIGDVGTTIAQFDSAGHVSPIEELEVEIAEGWGVAGQTVTTALSRTAGLTLQSSGFRYRASFDMDPDTFDHAAFDIVADLGLDALMSDNRFFDVLPKGVSKGPSLVRLLSHLGIDNNRTLVAGDTLNDLSMLELGLPAVAVGGSEPGLLSRLEGQAHVHCAKGEGVAGIAEAILEFDLLSKTSA